MGGILQCKVAAATKDSIVSSFFTLGHSNHTMEAWLALVRQHSIDVVVDTRSSPYSKYVPQFDRELIQRSLEEAGVRYLFLGAELGGRPANPAYYDATGHVLYSRCATMQVFKAAIARLETGIEKFTVALICGEEDPAHCHRRLLIGRVLAERGHTMTHIRGDGRLESDETVAAEAGNRWLTASPLSSRSSTRTNGDLQHRFYPKERQPVLRHTEGSRH
jgi:uncharacterized protein (DUF488 family)